MPLARKAKPGTGPVVGGEGSTFVHLHGSLNKFAPDGMRLNVTTTAGVIKTLIALRPGFVEAFGEGTFRIVRGDPETGFEIDEKCLKLRTAGRDLHIIPAAIGAKNSGGVAKIVIGSVIAIAAIATAQFEALGVEGATFGSALGATVPLGFGFTASFGQIALFGAAIALAGITSVLSTQKKNTGQNNNSFGLSGQINVTTEGSPVPVIYGRVMVGSVVVSAGYYAENIALGVDNTAITGTDYASVEGGTSASGDPYIATGGGGGGKGATNSTTEAPNTLQSDSIVRLIDLIGEGQVDLVAGAQSIFFNNTPLQAADGTYNFAGVTWQMVTGLPDQDPVPGYPSAEDTTAVNQNVSHATPYVISVSSSTADAVLVTVMVEALWYENVTNGDLEGYPNLQFTIDIALAGGSYTNIVNQTYTGQKCVSPYYVTYRIPLPNSGLVTAGETQTWSIRMTRVTPDDTTSNYSSAIYFASYDLVTDWQLSYPNSAYIAMTVDAASFGTTIPTRSYLVQRLDVQVPANFDPVARTYATSGTGTAYGTWDGVTFKTAVTDDPAWCLYDLLTNDRFGLGLPSAVTEDLVGNLYLISQYCNQQVPDGYGGTEPRYTLNVCLATQAEAYDALQSMVSVFRGMTYLAAGGIVATADMPTLPTALVTQANVVGGNFVYEGTGLNTRHNQARVTWLDPSNYYQPATEVVEETANIAQRGLFPTSIVAFGCVSRGLAHRLGKWILDTEQTADETVTYSCSFDQLTVRPGQVFAVADPNYAGVRMGGRCQTGCTTTTIFLDALVPAPGSNTYYLAVQMPDGTIAQNYQLAFIENESTYTYLTLMTPLPAAPEPDAVWIITSTSLAPRLFQCIGMSEQSAGVFQIVGMYYDPTKYERIEDGIYLAPNTFSVLPSLLTSPIPPPSNLQIGNETTSTNYVVGQGTTTVVAVTMSWTAPGDYRVVSYQILVSSSSYTAYYSTTGVSFDVTGLPINEDYVFSVRSVSNNGQTSAYISSSATNIDGHVITPDAPGGLAASGGIRSATITWEAVAQRYILYYEIWRGSSASYGPGAGAVMIGTVAGTTYVDSENGTLTPDSTWYYWVRATTTTLVEGAFAGPVSATISLVLAADLEAGIIATASIAEGLLTVSVWTSGSLPSGPSAVGGNDYIFNVPDKQLYKWDTGTSTWQPAVINGTQLVEGSITAAQIAANTITADQIASGTITFGNIANNTITASQIANNTITSGQIAEETITADKIAANTITSAQIASNTITSANIESETITAGSIAAGTITGDKIAGNTIVAANIQVFTITAEQIAANTITADLIAANTITAGQIAAGAIGADQIAANAIRTVNLASDFQLTESAQFGTAVIGTAQIENLSVGTQQVTSNAITQVASALCDGTTSNTSTDAITIYLDVSTAGGNDTSVLLLYQGSMSYSGDALFYAEILRDGSAVYTSGGMGSGFSVSKIDMVGSGSYTYTARGWAVDDLGEEWSVTLTASLSLLAASR